MTACCKKLRVREVFTERKHPLFAPYALLEKTPILTDCHRCAVILSGVIDVMKGTCQIFCRSMKQMDGFGVFGITLEKRFGT